MKLWLAPLDGISDCAFRTLCYNYGADKTFTPMVRVESLVRKNKSSLDLIDLKNKTPTGIQLLAVKVDNVKRFVASYNYNADSICLNLGCPSIDLIRVGAGAAMIKRISRVKEIVFELKKLDLPVYVKLRLGLNYNEMKKKVYLNLIREVDCDAFILHAKHAGEDSFTKSHWEVFDQDFFGKKIIPNGDINTREDLEHFKKFDTVMIGRAALKNPSVFSYLKSGKLDKNVKEEYLKLVKLYGSSDKFKNNVLGWLE